VNNDEGALLHTRCHDLDCSDKLEVDTVSYTLGSKQCPRFRQTRNMERCLCIKDHSRYFMKAISVYVLWFSKIFGLHYIDFIKNSLKFGKKLT